ncbi:hypothetical protein KC345_g145 [Hortaea werneckii]|nr:hypothetical protein KC345_g145 [Hortaea werneckii]
MLCWKRGESVLAGAQCCTVIRAPASPAASRSCSSVRRKKGWSTFAISLSRTCPLGSKKVLVRVRSNETGTYDCDAIKTSFSDHLTKKAAQT